MKPTHIVIHHSQTKDTKTVDWDAIKKYHKETNGWSDIGYHYGIESVDGVLAMRVGRPPDVPGAHCKDLEMNKKSLGVCLVGNYDLVTPSADRLKALADLVKALMK